jgi:hypothetical protein
MIQLWSSNCSHRSKNTLGSHPGRLLRVSYEQTFACHGIFREPLGIDGHRRRAVTVGNSVSMRGVVWIERQPVTQEAAVQVPLLPPKSSTWGAFCCQRVTAEITSACRPPVLIARWPISTISGLRELGSLSREESSDTTSADGVVDRAGASDR